MLKIANDDKTKVRCSVISISTYIMNRNFHKTKFPSRIVILWCGEGGGGKKEGGGDVDNSCNSLAFFLKRA